MAPPAARPGSPQGYGFVGGGVKTILVKRGMYFNQDMPGFGKEHVTLRADLKTRSLIVTGETGKEWGDDEDADESGFNSKRVFEAKFPPFTGFDLEKMTAKMQNGVLRLVVPQFMTKEEGEKERDGVIQIEVQ